MKFIFEKNAPDIPLEVLNAQENDSLILFCGAGISYPAGLPLFKGLVDEVYAELSTEPSPSEKQAIKQWRYDTALELLGQAYAEADLSELTLASIQPHSQNHRNNDNWGLLIELCRDLWLASYQTNKALALAVLELWKEIPFPVFKRLVFHAYTVSDIITPTKKLDYLFTEEAYWFWSSMVEREKFRLLAELCPVLSDDDLTRLQKVILTGVPSKISQDYFNPERMQERNDRRKWLHLAKLESFGVTLGEDVKIIYQSLRQQHPYWELEDNDRDEFSFWVGRLQRGSRSDLTASELAYFPVDERIEKLLDVSSEFFEERTEEFRGLCKEKPDIALETLSALAQHSWWNTSVWHAGLSGLSDSENPLWLDIAPLVVQFPEELFRQEAWVIVWWVQSAIKLIEPNSTEEAYFWQIFDLLIVYPKPIEIKKETIISQAINHPTGILTKVLITRIAERELNRNEKIADKKILECLNKLLIGSGEAFLLARVVLLSRLAYFYEIDPQWTQAHLIPLLDWEKDNAAFYWQGYLYNPRISVEIGLDIKEYLLITLQEHTQALGKASIQIFQLFAIICLEFEVFYTAKEQQMVLKNMSEEGLIEISQFIYSQMSKGGEKNDLYWKNRIEPFFSKAWPKDSTSLNAEIAGNFSSLCIALDVEFDSAVQCIKIILKYFGLDGFFLRQLKESKHIADHPLSVFELFQYVQIKDWDTPTYREIFISLGENAPSLKEKPRYKEIENILKGKYQNRRVG